MSKSGFVFYDCGRISYIKGWVRQREAFNGLLRDKAAGKQGCNRLFFCEHPPVFTLGKNGKDTNLLAPDGYLAEKGISFYRINRGGDITFHGWGQITGYPVFDLEYWKMGPKQYIYTLEEAVIRFLRLYDVRGERQAGAAGVWLNAGTPGKERKICAIGVKCSRYVTMHGFALNINTDLSYFSLINPCGYTDKGVTSLAKELGEAQDFVLAKERLHELFACLFPPA
jgi:lipoyl(octanoyl) transferase